MKKVKLAALLGAAAVMLSGCAYSVEVNEKAYVIALGIDKGKNEMYKVSFLFAYPDAGSGEESGGEKQKEKDLVTVEAPTLYSAMRLLDTFKSKQIDINHTKLVTFSEKLAMEDGINDLVVDLVNTKGFRPSIYVCVSQTEPEKLFKGMQPKQNTYIEKYIERLFSKMVNNDVAEAYLYNYYFNMLCETGCIMPVAGLTDKDGAKLLTEDYPYKKTDDFALNYSADNIPLKGDSIASLCGYAVFDGKKMVGKLGMLESDIVNIIEKNMPVLPFSVLVPGKNRYVSVSLHQNFTPKVRVKAGEVPEIDISVRLNGEFTGKDGLFKTEKDYRDFSAYLNSTFTQKAADLIRRSQEEFGTDILRLGERVKGRFLTVKEWERYDWPRRYRDAKINVAVTVDMNDFGELKYSPKKSV